MRKTNSLKIIGLLLCFVTLSACTQGKQIGEADIEEIPRGSVVTEIPIELIETEIPSKSREAATSETYNNPIDEYFLPKIESATSQINLRLFQENYKLTWETEFKNLIKQLKRKCIYDEDKKNILELEKSVQKNIDSIKEVLLTDLLEAYEVNPDPKKAGDYSRLSLWGNGTRSRLNQIEGEMYRDVSMRIISVFSDYEFIKQNYFEIDE